MRRLGALVALLLLVAAPAAAVSEPPRLAVTASSDDCAGGLPVVDYRVANQTSMPASVAVWWLADASRMIPVADCAAPAATSTTIQRHWWQRDGEGHSTS